MHVIFNSLALLICMSLNAIKVKVGLVSACIGGFRMKPFRKARTRRDTGDKKDK